jgi:ribosomal protein L40E
VNEQKVSQRIQFKNLLKVALTSGRITLFNNNIKKVGSISTVNQNGTEDEGNEYEEENENENENEYENENENETESQYEDENEISQDYYDSNEHDNNEYDSNEYDTNEYDTNEEFERYLNDNSDNDYSEDGNIIDDEFNGNNDYSEDGDIIDDEFNDDDDDSETEVKPSSLSLFSKKSTVKPIFHIKFNNKEFNSQSHNNKITTPVPVPPPITGFNWAAAGMKKPVDPEGTWECPSCNVKNKPDATQCIACETDKNDAKKIDDNKKAIPSFGFNKSNISFRTPSTPSISKIPSTGGFDWAASGMNKPVDPEGTWECSSCMIKNKPDATQCIACETDKPGTKKTGNNKKTIPTFGSKTLEISFGKPSTNEEKESNKNQNPSVPFELNNSEYSFKSSLTTTEEKKSPENQKSPLNFKLNSTGFSFGKSPTTIEKTDNQKLSLNIGTSNEQFSFVKPSNNKEDKYNNSEETKEDMVISATSTEPVKSVVGFSFITPNVASQKNDINKKTDEINIKKDKDDENDNNDLDLDTATEKISSLGGNTFSFKSTTNNEVHNVFGVTTKPTTTSIFAKESNNNTNAISSFVPSNITTTTSVYSGTNSFATNGTNTNFLVSSTNTPAFGQPSLGQPSSFNKSTLTQTIPFSQTSSNNAFDKTSFLGNSVTDLGFGSFSNENNQAASNKIVFGSSTQLGFGSTSMPGMNSAFINSSSINTSNLGSGKGFSAFSNNNTTSFSSIAHSNSNCESIFGSGDSFDQSKSRFGNSQKKSTSFSEYR